MTPFRPADVVRLSKSVTASEYEPSALTGTESIGCNLKLSPTFNEFITGSDGHA
jgi:hypothetical protein